ncbi:unnamed protein product, partial [Closterium sp. NIES-54]
MLSLTYRHYSFNSCAVLRLACAVLRLACAVLRLACAVLGLACAVLGLACAVLGLACAVLRLACAVLGLACAVPGLACAVLGLACAVLGLACAVLGLACAVLRLACAVLGLACAVLGLACAVLGLACAVLGLACAVLGLDHDSAYYAALFRLRTESGFSLQVKPFFNNFGAIVTFSCLGTFLSAIVTGILVYVGGFLFLMYKLSFLEALIFGSLISSTDPVAVLAIFQDVGADTNLYALVFGESVLNDA